MKISVDGVTIFELSDTQKKVMKDNIASSSKCPIYGDGFEADLKRRLHYILNHKYEECFRHLKEQWEPRLKANGVKSIPLDEEEFAKLVFAQPDYLDRDAREAAKK